MGRSPHTSPAPRLSQQLIYLPSPWGTCNAVTMDSDFFDSYSITACRIDCETRYLVENCNCRMVHMPGQAPGFQSGAISGCTAPHLCPICIGLPNPGPRSLHFLSFWLLSLSSCLCLQGGGGRVWKGWTVRVGHFQGPRDGQSLRPIFQPPPYIVSCHHPFSLYLSHHHLLSFAGDAPYCTPEQYKECADPALGEHL